MLDGFIRVAAGSPKIRVGDVDFNVELRIHTDGDNVYIAIVEQVKE